MVKYEWKKVFGRPAGRIAVLLLFGLLLLTCYFATSVSFWDEEGNSHRGIRAAANLRAAQKEWAGVLDEEKIREVIAENARIARSPEMRSADMQERNIAYGKRQGIAEIRNLLNYSFAEGFRSYDYYTADSLTVDAAADFYPNRTRLLKEWLAEEAKDMFSEAQKEYLIKRYEALETPFTVDYMKGWVQLMEYAPTIIMITMLILGYLTAGIFSNEFSWKADSIFFSSECGRNRAVAAKVKAGIGIVTLLYWGMLLLYTGIVLLYLGADGANCPVQADFTGWKCFYNITNVQKYVLTVVGGYLGNLFIALLTMLVSAKSRSTVLAVTLPFVLLFLPSFLGNIENSAVTGILALLPDRLLQINRALDYFDLFEFGGKVVGAVPILLVVYGVWTAALVPVLYQLYRRRQIR